MDRQTYADATTLSDANLIALSHITPVPADQQGALARVVRRMQQEERYDEGCTRAAIRALSKFL